MEPVKILIVEDELLTAERMQRALERHGCRITAVSRSEEQALVAIEKEKPDLILMDIRLEEKQEGISAAQKIKKTYSLPIIFITQLKDEEIFKQAKETFPQSYLTKPYNDSDLIHAVELAIQNSGNWLKNRKIKIIEQIKDGIFLIQTGSTQKTKLLYEDLLFIKASKAYTEIFYEVKGIIAKKPYQVTLSSNHVFEQIACQTIVKVHRSSYINTKKIDSFKPPFVYIHDVKIRVSKAYSYIVKNACKSIQHNLYKK